MNTYNETMKVLFYAFLEREYAWDLDWFRRKGLEIAGADGVFAVEGCYWGMPLEQVRARLATADVDVDGPIRPVLDVLWTAQGVWLAEFESLSRPKR